MNWECRCRWSSSATTSIPIRLSGGGGCFANLNALPGSAGSCRWWSRLHSPGGGHGDQEPIIREYRRGTARPGVAGVVGPPGRSRRREQSVGWTEVLTVCAVDKAHVSAAA